ncbi:hypothetical protein LOZ57_002613 [Ophidiomyces ophidiicola]|uniref:uncharacterized protein n=1 Tax=Ophidiomyces ophidiicola TaxID=1387563 RepID=UPI0020C3F719|nr:uncharacterized protein LOZ57_002613 [Ophidiomyces ophidiicola]KAI1949240.1 hypothetical protein LOZ57_002613 [Ophidiomyces ophidiicola]
MAERAKWNMALECIYTVDERREAFKETRYLDFTPRQLTSTKSVSRSQWTLIDGEKVYHLGRQLGIAYAWNSIAGNNAQLA